MKALSLVCVLCVAAGVLAQEKGELDRLRERLVKDTQGGAKNELLEKSRKRWPVYEEQVSRAIAHQDEARRRGNEAFAEAVVLYRDAAVMREEPVEHYLAGRILGIDGKLDEAKTHFERALNLDPYFYWAIHGLGTYFNNRQMWEPAMARYRQVLEIKPDFILSARGLALCQMRTGKREDADRTLRTILESNPNDTDTLWSLSTLSMDQGNYTEAINILTRLSALDPARPNVRESLALCYRRTDDPAKAEEIYQELMRSEPKDWRSAHFLGELLERQGKNHEAAAAFQTALDRGIQTPNFDRADYEARISELRAGPPLEVVNQNRKSPEEWVNLLRNSFEVDRRRQAIRVLSQAPIEYFYDNPKAYEAVLHAMNDVGKDPIVRVLAMKLVQKMAAPELLFNCDAVFSLLVRDSNTHVRAMAANLLGEAGNPAGVPALITALRDDDPYSFRQIHKALNRLTFAYIGVDLPLELSQDVRERIRSEWQAWFDKNRDRYRQFETAPR